MDTRINECFLQPLVRSDSVDRGTSAEDAFRNIVASFDLHGAPQRAFRTSWLLEHGVSAVGPNYCLLVSIVF